MPATLEQKTKAFRAGRRVAESILEDYREKLEEEIDERCSDRLLEEIPRFLELPDDVPGELWSICIRSAKRHLGL
jgi:predicted house-cleaning noncanonical NTP pyrophosphatase (MazG superfamily)